MSPEERLSQALAHLRSAEVRPVLLKDSALPTSNRAKQRWIVPLILAAIVISGGLVLLNSGLLNDSLPTVTAKREPISSGIQTAGTESGSSVVAPGRFKVGEIDPNSIVVLRMTPSELRRFGITQRGDTTELLAQSLVVADTALAAQLGLSEEQLQDSTLLFHWKNIHTPAVHSTIAASTFDGDRLDLRSAVGSYSVDTTGYLRPTTYVEWSLLDRELDNHVGRLILRSSPGIRTVNARDEWFALMKPDSVVRADQKPIIVQITSPTSRIRTFVAFMPTKAVLEQIPERFALIIERCYREFIPRRPQRWTWPKPSPPRTSALQIYTLESGSGQPYVELSTEALWTFGIVTDSITILRGNEAWTLDTLTWSFSPPDFVMKAPGTVRHAFFQRSPITQRIGDTSRSIDIIAQARSTPQQANRLVEAFELRDGKPVVLDTLHHKEYYVTTVPVKRTMEDSWLSQYPLAQEFAVKVSFALSEKGGRLDSIPYYWVTDGDVEIPVSRLLIPLRVTTPWTVRPPWQPAQRRISMVFWYYPTQDVLNALPSDVRDFLEPELRALYSSIEQRLSAARMCEIMEQPSALGLCATTDSLVHVNGVHPIPARDEFTVLVNSEISTTCDLRVISDDGRTLIQRENLAIQIGKNELTVPIAGTGLAAGPYVVVLRGTNWMRTTRVLVTR